MSELRCLVKSHEVPWYLTQRLYCCFLKHGSLWDNVAFTDFLRTIFLLPIMSVGRGREVNPLLESSTEIQPGIHWKINVTPQNRGLFCYCMPKTYPRTVKQMEFLQARKENTNIFKGEMRWHVTPVTDPVWDGPKKSRLPQTNSSAYLMFVLASLIEI